MTKDIAFGIELSSGLIWDISVNNGWLMIRNIHRDGMSCVVVSQSFSNASDWIRALVHLAQRSGSRYMFMETSTGSIRLDEYRDRLYKYTFRESRGFFYE